MIDIIDKVLSLIFIILLSPIFILISILILITSGRPVFFRQARLGKDGKIFQIYKFRTMVREAEELKNSLREKNEAAWPLFKISSDPRITGIGKILRKTSLDELPQLFNVLRGEMSLVGPRPLIPEEAEWLGKKRQSRKPGLTGPTQIYRNKAMSLETRQRLEEEYIDSRNFIKTNLIIILKTFPALFKGE